MPFAKTPQMWGQESICSAVKIACHMGMNTVLEYVLWVKLDPQLLQFHNKRGCTSLAQACPGLMFSIKYSSMLTHRQRGLSAALQG